MNIQTITNVLDCVPLYLPHSLYLKPLAKFYISVSLPANKLGKTISNYDIMDKLSSAIKPDNFSILKVAKSTLEFIRFEAELEDRSKLRNVLARLDGRAIKLSGFNDPFKVRASEAKDEFPSRHDWDSFFRDAKNMDEMKPGERPDTIHISNLPIRWFCPRHSENDENVKPSENIFKRIFEKFGSVRCVDVPVCDPYRSQMKTEITGMKTFNFDQEVMFEGYVQFSEYVGFVKAMDEFRGMKLVRKMGDKNLAVNISVVFDKSKHLCDASIKRRTIVRDRLIAKERAKQEEEARKKQEEKEKQEKERKKQEELKQKELEKQREREEKRKQKHLEKLQQKEQEEFAQKIRAEERKLLIAQRKLESIRVLEAVFERLKMKEVQKNPNIAKDKKNKSLAANDLRNKLLEKYKSAHANILAAHKQKIKEQKKKFEGANKNRLLNLLGEDGKQPETSPSINTISSDDSVLSDSHLGTKKKKQKREKKELDLSDSDSSENNNKTIPKTSAVNPFGALYNPEMAAEWLQMGMYPYTPMFAGIPPIRPGFFPGSVPFRGLPYRGRFLRGKGRGSRLRGHNSDDWFGMGMYPYASMFQGMPPVRSTYYPGNLSYRNQQYRGRSSISRDRDSRRFRSRSRSRSRSHRSRSKSRTRSRSRRRSRSRSRRSRTRRSDSRSRSKSRPRSKSRSRCKSRSRSKSPSRSKSRRRSRSRSRSTGRTKSKQKLVSTRRSRSSSSWTKSRSRSRSRSWSKARTSRETIALQPKKLVRSAKEIQRSVQQKLYDRMKEDEKSERRKSREENSSTNKDKAEASTSKKTPSRSRSRSASIDSSKFMSPKRKEKSFTPEKEWN